MAILDKDILEIYNIINNFEKELIDLKELFKMIYENNNKYIFELNEKAENFDDYLENEKEINLNINNFFKNYIDVYKKRYLN